MRVRAKMTGIYDDGKRRMNSEFNIKSADEFRFWMEGVDAEGKAAEKLFKSRKPVRVTKEEALEKEVLELRKKLAELQTQPVKRKKEAEDAI